MGVRTFRLAYVTAADAKTLIAPALSKDGMIAVTPAAGHGHRHQQDATPAATAYATDDVLVVRDYEENLDEGRRDHPARSTSSPSRCSSRPPSCAPR